MALNTSEIRRAPKVFVKSDGILTGSTKILVSKFMAHIIRFQSVLRTDRDKCKGVVSEEVPCISVLYVRLVSHTSRNDLQVE